MAKIFTEDPSQRLMVIQDVDTAYEFYMTLVDRFPFEGKTYVAMLPYEPDDGEHTDPEFVLMEDISKSPNEGRYRSIRNRHERKRAFDHFLQRIQMGHVLIDEEA